MILQLHDVYDPNKVSKLEYSWLYIACRMWLSLTSIFPVLQISVKIKIVSASPAGAVAAEAKKVHANWVVLDK